MLTSANGPAVDLVTWSFWQWSSGAHGDCSDVNLGQEVGSVLVCRPRSWALEVIAPCCLVKSGNKRQLEALAVGVNCCRSKGVSSNDEGRSWSKGGSKLVSYATG